MMKAVRPHTDHHNCIQRPLIDFEMRVSCSHFRRLDTPGFLQGEGRILVKEGPVDRVLAGTGRQGKSTNAPSVLHF